MPNKVWLLCIYRKNMKPLLEGSVSSMQKDIAFENECNIKKRTKNIVMIIYLRWAFCYMYLTTLENVLILPKELS